VLRHLSKPVFTVLRWQIAATLAASLVGALSAGANGAASAAAGGAISVAAGLCAAWLASRTSARSPGRALAGALRAEAVKIGLALFLVWLVLVNYPRVVVAALLGTFVLTMLIFAMAFFVRDY
jgi:F0F1-type ATP synthase assembly protein I